MLFEKKCDSILNIFRDFIYLIIYILRKNSNVTATVSFQKSFWIYKLKILKMWPLIDVVLTLQCSTHSTVFFLHR